MTEFVPNKLVKAGEVIFHEGDAPDEGIFYICYGEVSVVRKELGVDRELAKLGEGDLFGEMGIINSMPRNATVTALSDCGFFTINQQSFQHLVNQLDPLMRGAFRVFVLTIRDLMTQRELMTGQLVAIMEQVNRMPVPGQAGDDPASESGNLADGVARKMHY